MEGQKLLTVKDLKTYFYTSGGVSKAVDGVSFEVEKGEILGIVGESGSGKSVTSSSIIHLLPAKTGKIVGGSIDFNGTDVLKLSQKELLEFRGKDISMIFQNPMTSLSPVFKVGSQMVEMICAHQKVTKQRPGTWQRGAETGWDSRCQTADGGVSVRAVGRYVPEGYHSHVRVQQTADDHCG